MTPASWGVRRMLFGYYSHSRWLSCSRRWFAEYPPPLHLTLYTLRPTPYALHRRSHHLSCARRWFAVSSVFRVNPCSSVSGISPLPVVFCQWSGNILASFLSLPLAVMLSRISPRVSPAFTLYTLHSTPYQNASPAFYPLNGRRLRRSLNCSFATCLYPFNFATSTLQNKLLEINVQQKVGFMIIFAAWFKIAKS